MTLSRAIEIAVAAHSAQFDKAGAPYILHPLRVMMKIDNDKERIVAVLHDVLEDGPDEQKQAVRSELSRDLLAALECVTKLPSEEDDYSSFIRRLAPNPIARKVKIADLEDNLDVTRLKQLTEKDIARLNKYLDALRVLKAQGRILYFDMDNVLVDFASAFPSLSEETKTRYEGHLDDVPGMFALMQPMPGAIDAFHELSKRFEVYILSTAPWNNSSAWSDKLEWVKRYLGDAATKRLILSHHKDLNIGDFLIDDRLKHGVDRFRGEHIHFGSERFPDWPSVVSYLISR